MKNSPSSSCSRLRKHLTHEEQKLLDDMQRSREARQKKAASAKKTGRGGKSSLLLVGCVAALFGATAAPLQAADRPVSAPALYNEGNAVQRAGRLGPAILSYERARLLAQDDTAIAHNLDLARQKAGVAAPVIPWWQKPAHWLSFNGFAVLGSLSLLLFAVAFFGMPVLSQSIGSIAHGAAVSLGVVTLLAWSAVAARWPELDRAVVIGTQPTVHIAPAANAAVLFDLKAGELVNEGGSHGGFVRISTADGRSGWVSAMDVEKVIPSA
ncbi:MAG: SH3 domain-containing protein [Verrucomicrobia bacterium]|nr:SH3 domain-containing protein [Verrucomicrobiota bacterium]